MNKRTVFITGATGFLGSYLMKKLLDDPNVSLIALARASHGQTSENRIDKVLKYFYGNSKARAMRARIKIVDGEVNKDSLGSDLKTRKHIIKETDEICHCAAIASFRVPLARIRRSNVIGTENVLNMALACKDNGKLKQAYHISTTYVAGTKNGVFYEDDLDVGQKFNNTYEQTKYEAEIVARRYRKRGLDITIFRPSILTGDSVSGKTSNFKMLYQPLHFLSNELYDAIPAEARTEENLIPVDVAAEMICAIAGLPEAKNGTFHISNPSTIKLGHFIDIACEYFGFSRPALIPENKFNMKTLTTVQRRLIEPYMPYFNYRTSFDCTKTKALLGKRKFRYPVIDDAFLKRLFKYCLECGYIKQKKEYAIAG